MEPIYDRNGHTVGWVEVDVIYGRGACYRAFVQNGDVFTYEGCYLSTLNKEFFGDKSDDAVALIGWDS